MREKRPVALDEHILLCQETLDVAEYSRTTAFQCAQPHGLAKGTDRIGETQFKIVGATEEFYV